MRCAGLSRAPVHLAKHADACGCVRAGGTGGMEGEEAKRRLKIRENKHAPTTLHAATEISMDSAYVAVRHALDACSLVQCAAYAHAHVWGRNVRTTQKQVGLQTPGPVLAATPPTPTGCVLGHVRLPLAPAALGNYALTCQFGWKRRPRPHVQYTRGHEGDQLPAHRWPSN